MRTKSLISATRAFFRASWDEDAFSLSTEKEKTDRLRIFTDDYQ